MYTANRLFLIMLKILNIKFISEDKYVFFSDLYIRTQTTLFLTGLAQIYQNSCFLIESCYTASTPQ